MELSKQCVNMVKFLWALNYMQYEILPARHSRFGTKEKLLCIRAQ